MYTVVPIKEELSHGLEKESEKWESEKQGEEEMEML